MPVRAILVKRTAFAQWNPPKKFYEYFCTKCLDRQLFEFQPDALHYEEGHLKRHKEGLVVGWDVR